MATPCPPRRRPRDGKIAVTNTSDLVIGDLAGTVVLEGVDANDTMVWRGLLDTPSGPVKPGGLSVWHQNLDELNIPEGVVAVRIALGDRTSPAMVIADAAHIDRVLEQAVDDMSSEAGERVPSETPSEPAGE